MVMERHLQNRKGFTPRRRRKMNFTQRARRKSAKDAERVLEEWSVKDGTRIELIGMMWADAGMTLAPKPITVFSHHVPVLHDMAR